MNQEIIPEPVLWYEALTDKQRRFVEEYCVDWNATQAAIRAGYSENTPQQMGSENLSKPVIRTAIDSYLAELSMSSAEAVYKLSSWGRGTIEPFLNESGYLDLSSDSARANLHLIKKSKVTTRIERDGQTKVPVADIETVEIELHDAKDAVKTILDVHGKLIQKHQHTGADGGPIKTQNTLVGQWTIIDATNGQIPPPIDV